MSKKKQYYNIIPRINSVFGMCKIPLINVSFNEKTGEWETDILTEKIVNHHLIKEGEKKNE